MWRIIEPLEPLLEADARRGDGRREGGCFVVGDGWCLHRGHGRVILTGCASIGSRVHPSNTADRYAGRVITRFAKKGKGRIGGFFVTQKWSGEEPGHWVVLFVGISKDDARMLLNPISVCTSQLLLNDWVTKTEKKKRNFLGGRTVSC